MATLVKKALGTMIREGLEARGLPVIIKYSPDGGLKYEVEGELLTPGEVDDKFDLGWSKTHGWLI